MPPKRDEAALRRAAKEAERQRQIQRAQKLEIMWQKKQCLQEQEKERQMHIVQMRAQMPAYSLPYAQMPPKRDEAALRRAAEEAERQIQRAQKLEIMRQKKQRLQEQEKERQMRLEQQKHTVKMRAQMPAFSPPYAQMPPKRDEAALRRAAEEAERQIQRAQKLEIMRQKKQEYLEMQRQLAIQRLQEHEKRRQMRLEQQKHTVQMRAQMPAFSLPYAQNAASQAQSLPPMTQAAPTNGMGYMGYPAYSMQKMISTLPGQDPNMAVQQQYMPGQQPMYQQVASPGGPQQPAQPTPQQLPPHQQHHPPAQVVPGSAEAQLICFD
ncbi:hepatocyte growth factor-regulated tyrosine kinase substrate-like isoform X2 [Corythoichthys intestinalis]|nr:hepatocyte growth factor-regulated tyrosine kinase substrate-like isoform X2 [Corythoichthys intestinalis]